MTGTLSATSRRYVLWATLGSGAAHVDVLLPEGSDAHLLLERAAHGG